MDLFNLHILIIIIFPDVGRKFLELTWSNTLEMLSAIPPIFILLGLLDVWVQREIMIKSMGEKSGIIGIMIVFLLDGARTLYYLAKEIL